MLKLMKIILMLFVFIPVLKAQVKIGTDPLDIHPSAILELGADDKGFLLPRMGGKFRASISNPADGLQVYDTDHKALFVYQEGNGWVNLFEVGGFFRAGLNPKDAVFNGGNIGLGTTNPEPSAILELNSTQKGFLLPRMTSTSRTILSSPVAGLQVYDTDQNSIYFYNGSTWERIKAKFKDGQANSQNAVYSLGSVGIGNIDDPNQNAILELSSSDKGFLLPRLTKSSKDAMSNEKGMMVYDTDKDKPYVNNGLGWMNLSKFVDGDDVANAIYDSGSVGIGTNIVDGQAILELKSSSKGFLLPRLDSSQRLAITDPKKGLQVYDLDDDALYIGDGADWKRFKPKFQDGDTYPDNAVLKTGGVSIGNIGDPDNSAILELNSTDKGFLLPRMTSNQIGLVSNPAEGLMVFDKDQKMINYFKDGAWTKIYNKFIDGKDAKDAVYDTGSVAIGLGITEPNSSAILELNSPNKGFLLPRLTTANRLGLSSVFGMLVADADLSKLYFHDGSDWLNLNKFRDGVDVKDAVYDEGSVGIGTLNVNTQAVLELKSDDKGFLLPRLSTPNRTAKLPNPVDGLLLFDTTSKGMIYAADGSWNLLKTKFVDATSNPDDAIYDKGSVAVGTKDPNVSAILDLTSTAKGFLMPRMITNERIAINNPAKGLQVYDTSENNFYYYNGTDWEVMLTKFINGKDPEDAVYGKGSVAIGTTDDPDDSAILHLDSDNKGFLMPRMTTKERESSIVSPANGLQVYDSDMNALFVYNGSDWEKIKTKFTDALDPNNASYTKGSVGIGTLEVDDIAALEIKSDSKGFLLPRLTSLQRLAVGLGNPGSGLQLYDNQEKALYLSVDDKWEKISTDANSDVSIDSWENDGVNGYVYLSKKSNGVDARTNDIGVFVTDEGMLGIGVSQPLSRLQMISKNGLTGNVSPSDGIIVSRVGQLNNTNGFSNGQLVYLNADSNPHKKGYHFWDGIAWQNLVYGESDTTNDSWENNYTNRSLIIGKKSDGLTTRDPRTDFVINDTGNVGIRNDSPRVTLELAGKNANASLNQSDGIVWPRVNDLNVSGIENSQMVYLNTDWNGLKKGYYSWDGSEWQSVAVGNFDDTPDPWLNNVSDSRIELSSTSNGQTARPQGGEFIILDNGNVGIGRTNPLNKLEVAGDILVTNGYIALSDRRFKQNIKPISNALSTVMKIRGVTYDWNKKDFPQRDFGNRTQLGVIAQELESVLPELVMTDNTPDEFKSVVYDRLTVLLIEAVKEQQKVIDTQREDIESLKSSQRNLSAKLDLVLGELKTLK